MAKDKSGKGKEDSGQAKKPPASWTSGKEEEVLVDAYSK